MSKTPSPEEVQLHFFLVCCFFCQVDIDFNTYLMYNIFINLRGENMAKRGELTPIEQEFADIVETHDTALLIEKGELKEVSDVKISIPTKKVPITMKIYPALLQRVKGIAEKEQMPYQSLLNQWIAERTYFEEHKAEGEPTRRSPGNLSVKGDNE